MKSLSRALYALSILVFTCVVAVVVNFFSIPTHNSDATKFDTIIVLGYPTNLDGTPSPEQRERVLEAVREYQAGVAPNLIMTGTAAHNHLIESHTMAHLAVASGVPASAVLEEPYAHNTIQNLIYSAQLMRKHGWATAEIVSSPSHLPRAAILTDALNRQQPDLSFNWRTHAARWPPEYSIFRELSLYTLESWYSLKLRLIPPHMTAPAVPHQ